MKIVLVDHDDSFTYNLRQWLNPLSTEISVIGHRELSAHLRADLFVLSPGPKSPQDYPHVLDFLKQVSNRTAIFGVCLGLQMMVCHQGGAVAPYAPPLHGKKSELKTLHPSLNELQGLQVARYHSLYCQSFNSELFETLATSSDGKIPLWLKHRQKKWMGVQFHPESFLTDKPEKHRQVLKDWLLS